MKSSRIKNNIQSLKLRTKIFLILLILFLGWISILQFQTYKYPDVENIDKRINYLERVINQPLNGNSEVTRLGYENPEFTLFTYAYSTYAFTNLAIKDSTYKQRVVPLIKESILKVLDSKITSTYSVDSTFILKDSIPDYSVLYLGHLNLMMGCYRLLSKDSTFNNLNNKISGSLFKRYNEAKFFNLESYPSSIWIPDNSVAIASLKLHSTNTKSNYSSACTDWVNYLKQHYIEKETGVLYSTLDSKSGKAIEEPRGSMLGWSILFIYQFDSQFAIELYNNYKKNFSNDFLVFRLFRERSENRDTSIGDIDSGPIFLGYSIPANEFALGASNLSGDYKTAKKLERLINFGTSQIEDNNEFKYKVKFTEMNISPMAEALVLNSLTITKWVE
ncbi:hypothetical protein CLV62_101370 [Dysgonomonas alginatilytica]|uniref:Uncharacterized protein n=1 Tax=Dysgonomonas alginatilytica TaxID=1605892 RepID=A0A2V3PW82_9BACT|nr:hypothetical protein [Dysgonomonas alginatilytica]PXV69101.1 hypothetical protein CLV62_101370 [Dysgonomonas alginatilytica]